MATAVCKLESISPYSQSKHYEVDKLEKESNQDYEKRTWRERCHADANGELFIPPMAFKNSIAEAAKYLSETIKGKGKATYTKHFEAGVMVMEPLPLGIKKADVLGEWLFVPSDGKRGSGSRVSKCFPCIGHAVDRDLLGCPLLSSEARCTHTRRLVGDDLARLGERAALAPVRESFGHLLAEHH